MNWPMETVELIDVNGESLDEWTGYLVPEYLAGLPNENARACYTLEFECRVRWTVACGPLDAEVWDVLMAHDRWCKS